MANVIVDRLANGTPDLSGIVVGEGKKLTYSWKINAADRSKADVWYIVEDMVDGEKDLLEERLDAIKTDYVTLMQGAEAGTLTNAQAQAAIGKAMRGLKEVASYLLQKGVFS